MSLRIIFMGTPDFSVPALTEITGQGHEVVACYTRAPKPGGRRGLELTKSPVHRAAEQLGIPVFTPKTLRDEDEQARFAAFAADVAVVVAYGLILPRPILDTPLHGCLNLHASLLPRWRGAAPIQRAIMAGDRETGVMVMQMEEGLDTGPVAMVERMTISENMTAGEAHDELMRLGASLLPRALSALARGTLVFTPQGENGVLYAHKIDKAETRIDWSLPAQDVHNRIRGLSPFPGAWFEADFGKGPERVKVLRSQLVEKTGLPGVLLDDQLTIACGSDAVRLLQLQRAGRGVSDVGEFIRGAKFAPGLRFA